jgi:sulfate adenylyltransferase subunit 1 (EFTu-like GTPase family)
MNVDDLRNDGIGRLLVEKGKITEDQLEAILEKHR